MPNVYSCCFFIAHAFGYTQQNANSEINITFFWNFAIARQTYMY